MSSPVPPRVRQWLICPRCRGELADEPGWLVCVAEGRRWPVVDGVPWLIPEHEERAPAAPVGGAAR